MGGREFVRDFMAARGRTYLAPAREEDDDSVWVMDDKAPGGVAGYYRKVSTPLPHRWISDGRSAALRFGDVEIRSSKLPTREANEDEVAAVLQQLLDWVDRGIVSSLDVALLPFSRDDPEVWWRVLRVPVDATEAELDSAYKRQAFLTHPDRGGTEEAFVRTRRAYEEGLERIRR